MLDRSSILKEISNIIGFRFKNTDRPVLNGRFLGASYSVEDTLQFMRITRMCEPLPFGKMRFINKKLSHKLAFDKISEQNGYPHRFKYLTGTCYLSDKGLLSAAKNIIDNLPRKIDCTLLIHTKAIRYSVVIETPTARRLKKILLYLKGLEKILENAPYGI